MTPQQLKNAILQQAIQGKLVEQRVEEGTGQELFEEIQKFEDSLIRNKSIKKEKPFPSIEENEYLFDIPDNWIWVRFGELGRYKKGPFGSALTKNIFVPKGDNTIKVYEQKNAIKKDATIGQYYITKDYFINKLSGFSVEPGDIIVSCAGTIGETFVMPDNIEKGIINQALMRMRLFEPIFVEYFLLYFDYVLKKNARENSKGSAIKNIPPFAILKNYLVPLPPLAEQQRIVEKIEELLPLIERYEKAWTRLEELNKKFPLDMQKAILGQAIQGKLVEQRVEEGTGEELYKVIQYEKKKLIQEGKLKKQKVLTEITEDEIPFEIPDTWKWVRLGNLAKVTGGYAFKSNEFTEQGVRVIRISDFNENGFVNSKIVRHSYDDTLQMFLIEKKNILLCMTGGTVGKSLFVRDLEEPMMTNQRVATIKIHHNLFPEYINYNVLSPIVQKTILLSKNSTNDNISMDTIKSFLIPLSPLAEQKRIVEKIEELLPLVEKLK